MALPVAATPAFTCVESCRSGRSASKRGRVSGPSVLMPILLFADINLSYDASARQGGVRASISRVADWQATGSFRDRWSPSLVPLRPGAGASEAAHSATACFHVPCTLFSPLPLPQNSIQHPASRAGVGGFKGAPRTSKPLANAREPGGRTSAQPPCHPPWGPGLGNALQNRLGHWP